MMDRLQAWRLYHFHDTSFHSPMKKTAKLHDNRFLRQDGSNLASFLYLLRERHETSYRMIRSTIGQVAPFFHDFALEPTALNPDTIQLEWRHKNSDAYFDASSLSDGTLRFMALTTLLLQPAELRPGIVLLDEPELGLHPYAIAMLAAMLRSASTETQIVVATQSPGLLDHFEPEDILVAERVAGETRLNRLEAEKLQVWLEDYSLGQLWEKNHFGGRPADEAIRNRDSMNKMGAPCSRGRRDGRDIRQRGVGTDHLRAFGYIQYRGETVGQCAFSGPAAAAFAAGHPNARNLETGLRQDSSVVALMVDYYALPQSGPRAWPGRGRFARARMPSRTLAARSASHTGWGRFRPGPVPASGDDARIRGHAVQRLRGVRESNRDRAHIIPDLQRRSGTAFPNPEEIDDSPETAPSKRIEALFPAIRNLDGQSGRARNRAGPHSRRMPAFPKLAGAAGSARRRCAVKLFPSGPQSV